MGTDRHWPSSWSTSVSLLFLAFPGCCAGQSRAGCRCSPLSVASRAGTFLHVLARSSHAPGTRPATPRRIRHWPSGIHRVALCLPAILCGNLCRNGPLGTPGGESLPFPASNLPTGIRHAGQGMPIRVMSVEPVSVDPTLIKHLAMTLASRGLSPRQ